MNVLEQMQPIGLEEMKAVRLMDRVERKYLASVDLMEPLLERVADRYYMQLGGGYRTLYFDTAELAMYTMHHNGKVNRQKVRVRTYHSSNNAFFEIKTKLGCQRTHKERIAVDATMFDHVEDIPEVRLFVEQNTPYTLNLNPSTFNLKPSMETWFERITLVNKRMSERVTIDRGLRFHNRATAVDADLSRLLVIEVKLGVDAPPSDIEGALHRLHIRPRHMSKYCLGTALTNPAAKHNRFKENLLFINKIQAS